MATKKVGIYRSYYGPVPVDRSGQPLPEAQWPKKRAFSWVVRWFGVDGDRYSKSFKGRKDAERFAESKQSDVRANKADPPPPVSLRMFHKEHGELMKGNLARKTLRMHLDAIAMLAGSVGWEHRLTAVSVRDIEKLRAARLATGIAASTANRELRTLKRIFNLAVMRGYLPEGGNPCTKIPMLKVASKKPAYLSPVEFQAVCQKAPDLLWSALLVTLYTTAIRLREATNLTWADIDFEKGELHVTRKSAAGLVQAWTPKDHELRTIPLTRQAVDLLVSWQAVAPEGCPYVFMEVGRWEFYRQRVGTESWRDGQDLVNNLLRRFQTICRRAGVGSFTIHDLRRYCITNWAGGLPIHVVQQLAGHSDIKTTQQYYLSVRPKDDKKAQQVQESLLGNILAAGATDQLLTNSARKRGFPGRQGCQPKKEALDSQGLT